MAKKHFNISEIVVKGRDSDYEKRFAEHMKQVIDSGSKTYNLTSKETFDMYNCPEIMERGRPKIGARKPKNPAR